MPSVSSDQLYSTRTLFILGLSGCCTFLALGFYLCCLLGFSCWDALPKTAGGGGVEGVVVSPWKLTAVSSLPRNGGGGWGDRLSTGCPRGRGRKPLGPPIQLCSGPCSLRRPASVWNTQVGHHQFPPLGSRALSIKLSPQKLTPSDPCRRISFCCSLLSRFPPGSEV